MAQRDERLRKLRETYWPDSESEIFDPGKRSTAGYARIPRLVPMVAGLVNGFEKVNAGSVYQLLWGRDWGQSVVEVQDPDSFMLEAGYSASRARRTYDERIKVLEDALLIRTAQLGAHARGLVLLRDPHRAILELYERRPNDFPKGWMEYFRQRCAEIGVDLERHEKALKKRPGGRK